MVNFPRQARDKHMRKAQKGGDLFVCVQGEPLPREGRRLENHKEYMQPLRAATGEKTGLVGHFGPLCGKTGSGQT
jgi:hypothetical protein